jgi:hypothetical protein
MRAREAPKVTHSNLCSDRVTTHLQQVMYVVYVCFTVGVPPLPLLRPVRDPTTNGVGQVATGRKEPHLYD